MLLFARIAQDHGCLRDSQVPLPAYQRETARGTSSGDAQHIHVRLQMLHCDEKVLPSTMVSPRATQLPTQLFGWADETTLDPTNKESGVQNHVFEAVLGKSKLFSLVHTCHRHTPACIFLKCLFLVQFLISCCVHGCANLATERQRKSWGDIDHSQTVLNSMQMWVECSIERHTNLINLGWAVMVVVSNKLIFCRHHLQDSDSQHCKKNPQKRSTKTHRIAK